MKLLVLAQTPPPLHGQSLMVQTLVDELPARGFNLKHIPLRLSRESREIGSWRPRKVLAAIQAALATRRAAREEKFDALYYVPAPAKRGAFYRDLVVLALCRRHVPKLVLHWHASGLGEWLNSDATEIERNLARRALGRADLSVVLARELAADAKAFAPLALAIVPNGRPDPGPTLERAPNVRCEVLFLGLGSASKGLFTTVAAVIERNKHEPGSMHLTYAGHFETAADERLFQERAAYASDAIHHVGFADETQRKALFTAADVFSFPTCYPHEGQPLTLIEAMAHDARIVTTRWRAIPGMLPPGHVWFVEPNRPTQLATTLATASHAPAPGGALRRHFLAHFTQARHLDGLVKALQTIAPGKKNASDLTATTPRAAGG